ncbi:Gpi16 subunit, GPI transamidase component-domain-containing protein [Podospora fimiseda]|uniref:Gpi16 subunit, GPI transamidase component-domain-containing protein n=1 Tax=Podospora fimiseda TaxID=252190 RepID=A0AAN7BGH6_9PEZI|nr:Gpi16 subunit, GPI transamidase component-domain-containing protein [Podospora fimiseda]
MSNSFSDHCRYNRIPRPPPGHELPCNTSKPYHSHDTCFPADHEANQDWTLSQIFGKYMKGTCPITDPTVPPVRLQAPNSRSVYVSDGVLEKKNLDRVSRWPGARRCPDHPAKPQPRY